jgi:hypothetical protein
MDPKWHDKQAKEDASGLVGHMNTDAWLCVALGAIVCVQVMYMGKHNRYIYVLGMTAAANLMRDFGMSIYKAIM